MGVKWYGKKVIDKVNKNAMDVIKKACFVVEGDAKKLQTPHVDTGRLRASISSNWTGSGMTEGKVDLTKAKPEDGIGQPTKKLTGVVGSNVEYAKEIEMGTEKHPPYPYLRPALHNNEKKILQMFKKII